MRASATAPPPPHASPSHESTTASSSTATSSTASSSTASSSTTPSATSLPQPRKAATLEPTWSVPLRWLLARARGGGSHTLPPA
eukprot:1994381-Pleurochrysis_carterae.AAC.1